jgi:type II secretory pathway component PulM
MRACVNKWTKNLHEELNMRIHGTQINRQAVKLLVEVTWQELKPEWGMEFVGTHQL